MIDTEVLEWYAAVCRSLVAVLSQSCRSLVAVTIVLGAGVSEGQASTPLGELPCRIVADQNCDGVVTPADFNVWISNYSSGNLMADQNGDAVVDPSDFSAWVVNFSQGENGPRGPAYDCQACTPTPPLVVKGVVSTSPFVPIDVVTIDVDEVNGTAQAIEAGTVVDAVLFEVPGLADARYEDRLVEGDDPDNNPPAGQVNLIFEHPMAAALTILRTDGTTYHISALLYQLGYQTVIEEDGTVVSQDLHFTDTVEEVGRFSTFTDAIANTLWLEDAMDLEVENPDPVAYPDLDDVLLVGPAPDIFVFDLDTGTTTREPAGGARQPNCNNPTTCLQIASCRLFGRSQICSDTFRRERRNCTFNLLAGGGAGCAIGLAVCGWAPVGNIVCCAAGGAIGAAGAWAHCNASAISRMLTCHEEASLDYKLDVARCRLQQTEASR